MNDLGTHLRATAGDPPPAGIDLDALIGGELRRTRRLRLAAMLGATTAVLTVAVTTAVLASGGAGTAQRPGGDPAGTARHSGGDPAGTARPAPATGSAPGGRRDGSAEPTASVASGAAVPCGVVVLAPSGVYQSFTPVRPDPTGNPGEIARRLSAALDAGLSRVLPSGAVVTDVGHVAGCDRREFIFDPQRRSYRIALRIDTATAHGLLDVTVVPTASDGGGCPWGPSDRRCGEVKRLPNASYYTEGMSSEEVPPPGGAPKVLQDSVYLNRDDGTTLRLVDRNNIRLADGSVDTPHPGAPLPLGIEQLLTLGQADGLTLYP